MHVTARQPTTAIASRRWLRPADLTEDKRINLLDLLLLLGNWS